LGGDDIQIRRGRGLPISENVPRPYNGQAEKRKKKSKVAKLTWVDKKRMKNRLL